MTKTLDGNYMDKNIELYKNKMRSTPDQIITYFLIEEEFGESTVFAANEDAFFEWKNGYYQPINEKSVQRTLWKHVNLLKARRLAPDRLSISAASIKNLYETMKLAHKNTVDAINTPYIGFNDGFCLNLNTFELEKAEVGRPIFFGIDFPSTIINEPASCPEFERFIKSTLVQKDCDESDDELISFVQEVFGYCLTNSIAAHATFFFYGSGRNGKSVLLDVLRRIVGERFISNMSIQALTTQRFSTASLVGKKLNIASEEESKFIKCDVFKGLVAGDVMTVERKHRDPFDYRPNAKFLFSTNQIPVFDSTDVAIRDRVFIIPFYRYFSEDERDRDLSNKLKAETGAILGWALEGARRISERGFKFVAPKAVTDMVDIFQREQSSALTFVDEHYEISGSQADYVVKGELYSEYSDWCTETGRHRKNDSNFYRDLLNVYRDKIDVEARRAINGNQVRIVKGVKRISSNLHDSRPAF